MPTCLQTVQKRRAVIKQVSTQNGRSECVLTRRLWKQPRKVTFNPDKTVQLHGWLLNYCPLGFWNSKDCLFSDACAPGRKELARTLTLQINEGRKPDLSLPQQQKRPTKPHRPGMCGDRWIFCVLSLCFLSLKSGDYRIYHRAQRKWSPVYKITAPGLLLSPIELPLLRMCAQTVIMRSNPAFPFPVVGDFCIMKSQTTAAALNWLITRVTSVSQMSDVRTRGKTSCEGSTSNVRHRDEPSRAKASQRHSILGWMDSVTRQLKWMVTCQIFTDIVSVEGLREFCFEVRYIPTC